MNLHDIRMRFASPQGLRNLLFFYFLSQGILLFFIGRLGFGAFIKLQHTFLAPALIQTFAEWRAKGVMTYYQWHFVPDFIHPLIYTAGLLSLLSVLMVRKRCSKKWNVLLIFPLLAGISDYIENVLQVLFLAQGDVWIRDTWVGMSASASTVKWSCAVLSLLMAVLIGSFRKQDIATI